MIIFFSYLRVSLGWSCSRLAVSLHHVRTPVLEAEAPALEALDWTLQLGMYPWLQVCCWGIGCSLYHRPVPLTLAVAVSPDSSTPHGVCKAWAPLVLQGWCATVLLPSPLSSTHFASDHSFLHFSAPISFLIMLISSDFPPSLFIIRRVKFPHCFLIILVGHRRGGKHVWPRTCL